MDDYDVERAYALDPDGVTSAVISAAAASAAAEVAAAYNVRRGAEFDRVRQGQEESATLAAVGHLEAKYGREELQRLQPKVAEKLSSNPHLVPQEILTSPTALTTALEDVLTLARSETEAGRHLQRSR